MFVFFHYFTILTKIKIPSNSVLYKVLLFYAIKTSFIGMINNKIPISQRIYMKKYRFFFLFLIFYVTLTSKSSFCFRNSTQNNFLHAFTIHHLPNISMTKKRNHVPPSAMLQTSCQFFFGKSNGRNFSKNALISLLCWQTILCKCQSPKAACFPSKK